MLNYQINRPILVISLIAFLILGGCVTKSTKTNVEANTKTKDAFSIGLNQDRDYLIVVNDDNEYEFGGDYD